MQAIVTRFICPTNHRGSRVKATAAAGSLILSWDHALNPEDNHRTAAKAFATKMGWSYGPHHGGCLPDGSWAWVCQNVSTPTFEVISAKDNK